MEEKIIIEGKPSKKTSSKLLKIGLVMLAVGLLLFFMNARSCWRLRYYDPGEAIPLDCYIETLGDCLTFGEEGFIIVISVILDVGILFSIYSLILWLCIKDNCITVTNKRVYGVTKWSKRVDLPLNQISAVGTSSLKGIAVGTSSGKIVFKAIENYIDVHKEITGLLASKQDTSVVQAVKPESNNMEDLKKFKELLDMGVITQEEFDAKKKQLLGL